MPVVLGFGPPASSFSPTNLPGLVAWFDMLDPSSWTESGGFVTSITNKASGVAWNTAQTVHPGLATGINGLPTMNFNGTTQSMSSTEAAVVAAFTNSPARTIYAVARSDVADTISAVFGFGNSGQATASSGGFGINSTGVGRWAAFHRNAANTANNDDSAGDSDTNSNVLCCVNSATAVSIRINGGAADPSAASASYGTTTPDRCAIGGQPRNPDGVEWDGSIGEVIMYTAEHDLATQNAVIAYLGARWGIAVAA